MSAPSRRSLLSGLGTESDVSTPTTTCVPATAIEPDAAIVRLCAEHIANSNLFNTSVVAEGSPEYEVEWKAYTRTREAIDAVRPVTLQGILAKAAVTQHEASQPCGWEDWQYEVVSNWARDVVKDLLRIGGKT